MPPSPLQHPLTENKNPMMNTKRMLGSDSSPPLPKIPASSVPPSSSVPAFSASKVRTGRRSLQLTSAFAPCVPCCPPSAPRDGADGSESPAPAPPCSFAPLSFAMCSGPTALIPSSTGSGRGSYFTAVPESPTATTLSCSGSPLPALVYLAARATEQRDAN